MRQRLVGECPVLNGLYKNKTYTPPGWLNVLERAPANTASQGLSMIGGRGV